MSLILVRVNRETHVQTIYSEGMVGSKGGCRIFCEEDRKVRLAQLPNCSILIGTTGSTEFGRYFRLKFGENVEPDIINNILFDDDQISEYLIKATNTIWTNFCTERRIPVDNTDFFSFEGILAINGCIFVINEYRCDEINTWQCYAVNNKDYYAIGVGNTELMCLLDNNVEVQQAFDTICKYYQGINNKVYNIPVNYP